MSWSENDPVQRCVDGVEVNVRGPVTSAVSGIRTRDPEQSAEPPKCPDWSGTRCAVHLFSIEDAVGSMAAVLMAKLGVYLSDHQCM